MKTKQARVLGTLLLLMTIDAIGCDGAGSASAPLDAEKFTNAYKQSPSKYKDKELTIKGRVERIDEDHGKEREWVSLVPGAEFGNDIKCTFPKENRKSIQDLKSNDVVIIKGKCAGLGPNRSILIENCSLVKWDRP
jgi:hypothetical protein